MADEPMMRPSVERHFQTIVGILVVGVMGWVGYNVNESAKDIVKLATKLESLQDQIENLREGTRERYTKTDAARDFLLRDSNISSLLARIDRLEGRVFFQDER